jgi:hypothetical protein
MHSYRVASYQLTKYATVRKPSGPPPILIEVVGLDKDVLDRNTATNAAKTAVISKRLALVRFPRRSLGCLCGGFVMMEGHLEGF